MLDFITVFRKDGIVLYHDPPSTLNTSLATINYFIANVFLGDQKVWTEKKAEISNNSLGPPRISIWDEYNDPKEKKKYDLVCVAFYSNVLEGRKDMTWVSKLCKAVLKEFSTADFAACTDLQNHTFHDRFAHILSRCKQLRSSHNNAATSSQPNQTTNHKSVMSSSKKNTVWHDGNQKITKSAMAELDKSKENQNGTTVDVDTILTSDGNELPMVKEARAAFLPSQADLLQDENDDNDNHDTNSNEGESSYLSNLYAQVTGQMVLKATDIEAPLQDLQTQLQAKNVGAEIATDIINNLRQDLIGKRLAPLMTISSYVRMSMERVIRKMLNTNDFDLLHDIYQHKASYKQTKPYVIVMVGINGVGKSTSLAKIAYYLKNNGCNPLLAACDTFRSGAVEQLAVHAKCLDVPLFHKGYAKDSSSVAKEAIAFAAKSKQYDVVLIDTAGRMQNNKPLMKALNKLVSENNPNLITFVCEALVGNDGIDELRMFDSALRSGNTNHIGGIVLTKFDTVSDKVGAVLTMSRVVGSKAKILFVGVGQKYNHLRKLNPKLIVKELFS